MTSSDPKLMTSKELHDSVNSCYSSDMRLGQAWMNKFARGLSWPEVFYEEDDNVAVAKIYQMFCEPTGIPAKTLKQLPPGQLVGLYVIRTMSEEVCQAIRWKFRETTYRMPMQDLSEIREAFFRLDNGEYLGEAT